jgi:hypothetical protein
MRFLTGSVTATTRFETGRDFRATVPRFAPDALPSNMFLVELVQVWGHRAAHRVEVRCVAGLARCLRRYRAIDRHARRTALLATPVAAPCASSAAGEISSAASASTASAP